LIPGYSGGAGVSPTPPGAIVMTNLPDLSDAKSASYNDEPIMGRTMPMKTYSHSENRSISLTIHFAATNQDDLSQNLNDLRALESCVYPRTATSGLPFVPPPVCQIKCGQLLGKSALCVVLKSYSIKFPTDVPWDDITYVPYKFDVDTQWDVVYDTANLPGQERILQLGN
jgi:hypothetical protein